jgi:DnaK suppressor protein
MNVSHESSNPSGLTQEQLTRLHGLLHTERETLDRRILERRRRLTGLSDRRPDDADWAADSADQSLMARLTDRDSKLLREIDRALRKLEAGTYGVCELSGDPIGYDRLLVRPWSRHALVVKEMVEREKDKKPEGPVVERAEDGDDGEGRAA